MQKCKLPYCTSQNCDNYGYNVLTEKHKNDYNNGAANGLSLSSPYSSSISLHSDPELLNRLNRVALIKGKKARNGTVVKNPREYEIFKKIRLKQILNNRL
jgi:hypothetical protein